MTAPVAKMPATPDGVWEWIRALALGDLGKLLPAAVVLAVILAVCVAFFRVLLIGGRNGGSEAARIAAIVAGFVVAFILLLRVPQIDWSAIGAWAVLAILLVEIPKSLRELNCEGLAMRVGVVYALAFALIISLALARGESVLAKWQFPGLLLGLLFSFAFFGQRPLFRILEMLWNRRVGA